VNQNNKLTLVAIARAMLSAINRCLTLVQKTVFSSQRPWNSNTATANRGVKYRWDTT